MTGPADALEIFPTIWIPCPEFPNESGWDDVVDMASRARHFEIDAAQSHFAVLV